MSQEKVEVARRAVEAWNEGGADSLKPSDCLSSNAALSDDRRQGPACTASVGGLLIGAIGLPGSCSAMRTAKSLPAAPGPSWCGSGTRCPRGYLVGRRRLGADRRGDLLDRGALLLAHLLAADP